MRETSASMYAAHSTLGVAAGLFLYALLVTGIPALFEVEVSRWESPSLRFAPPPEYDVDALVEHGIARAPEGTQDMFVFLPGPARASAQFLFGGTGTWLDLHPLTGEELATTQDGFVHVWAKMHTSLLMGRAGRYLVGFGGLLMLFMLLSGVLAHRKLLHGWFTWRRDRSLRVATGDFHKLVGVWTAPALAVSAFTGAILGLLGVLGIANALVAYGGDQEAAVAAVLGPPVNPIGEPRVGGAIAPILARARAEHPHVQWHTLRLMAWGDANAHVELEGNRGDAIARASSVRYRLHDESLVHTVDWVDGGIWRRAFGLLFPLHFGDYGGLPLKVVYALFALAGAVLVASGLTVWMLRRHRARSAFHAVIAGVVGGVPLATCVVPLVDRAVAATGARGPIVIGSYLVVLVASVGVARLRGAARVVPELLVAAASCASLAPVLDTITSGPELAWRAPYGAAVNFGFVATALVLAVLAWLVPVPR